MREIKYIAYLKKHDMTVDVGSIDFENKAIHAYIAPDTEGHWFLFEEIELREYTGLKDKNGKEIYEGDIVKYETNYYGNHKEHITKIEWYDDLEHDGFGEPLAMGYLFIGYNQEVIGNIYENPELITQ